MATNDIGCKKYEPIPKNWDNSLKDCCINGPKDEPKGCDCCYDNWSDQLKLKQDEFGRKSEAAIQAKDKLAFSRGRRDGYKKWYDGMLVLDEQAKDICNQFDLIISQVDKICKSSDHTVKATEILFCMVRDFYTQLDKIRIRYEELENCIKYLDKSIMVPGQGFMKCLEMYRDKLDLVLKTKDDIIKQVMDIIKLANLVNEDVRAPFGLSCILQDWKTTLGCTAPPKNDDNNDCKDTTKTGDDAETSNYDGCQVIPQFGFPIWKDNYFGWVKTSYENAAKEVEKDNTDWLAATKDREAIAASIASLKEATAITNPKDRCK